MSFPFCLILSQAFKTALRYKFRMWSSHIYCLCIVTRFPSPRIWSWGISLPLTLLCSIILASSLNQALHDFNCGAGRKTPLVSSIQSLVIILLQTVNEFKILFKNDEYMSYANIAFLKLFKSNIVPGFDVNPKSV